jgi:hypothetical protein
MSDVTDQYIVRTRQAAEDQHTSSRAPLSNTLQHQTWMVEQASIRAGALSLNEQDLRKNLHWESSRSRKQVSIPFGRDWPLRSMTSTRIYFGDM